MGKVAVSLLGVNNNEKSKITTHLINNGLTWVHYDVMDGIFVPDKAISFHQVKKNIEKTKKHFVDIHLMVSDPERYIEKFKNIANLITFHFESEPTVVIKKIISKYKNSKFKLGIAVNPQTNIRKIYSYLMEIDLILIMSVNPGLGGQTFQYISMKKIFELKKYINEHNYKTLIEVDGGIDNKTGPQVIKAGADIIVSGSYLCLKPTKKRLQLMLNQKNN